METPLVSEEDRPWSFWAGRGTEPPQKGKKEIPVGEENCLFGTHFLITGILDSLEREQAWDLIKQYGGAVHKSIVKKLTHVIVGNDPGPTKIAKLKQRPEVQIINEDQFLGTYIWVCK
jgi:replication factor C subunit 1